MGDECTFGWPHAHAWTNGAWPEDCPWRAEYERGVAYLKDARRGLDRFNVAPAALLPRAPYVRHERAATSAPQRSPVEVLAPCAYVDLPRGAQALFKSAVAAGWVVRIYACKGFTLRSKLVVQHMLYLVRGRRRLVAWWQDGATQGGLSWGEEYLHSVKLQGMRVDE